MANTGDFLVEEPGTYRQYCPCSTISNVGFASETLAVPKTNVKVTHEVANRIGIDICWTRRNLVVGDKRNRAAAFDVDFKFHVVRRSGSRKCSSAFVPVGCL
jgi:hypothetical protein